MSAIQQIFKPITRLKENLEQIDGNIHNIDIKILSEIKEAKKTTLVIDFNAKVKEILNKYKPVQSKLLKEKIKIFKAFNDEKRNLMKSAFISTNVIKNILIKFTFTNDNYVLRVVNYPQKMNYPNSNCPGIFPKNYLCLISKDFPKSYLNRIQPDSYDPICITFDCWNSIKQDKNLNQKIFPLFESSLDNLLIYDPEIFNAFVDFPIFNYYDNKFLLKLSKEDQIFLEDNICNKKIDLNECNRVFEIYPKIQEDIERYILNSYQLKNYEK
ncbi:MAG: hypothetical protein PHS54_01935 [Clostridia bacterium]|nr:hypothetical protein [Clostridia bacterium]